MKKYLGLLGIAGFGGALVLALIRGTPLNGAIVDALLWGASCAVLGALLGLAAQALVAEVAIPEESEDVADARQRARELVQQLVARERDTAGAQLRWPPSGEVAAAANSEVLGAEAESSQPVEVEASDAGDAGEIALEAQPRGAVAPELDSSEKPKDSRKEPQPSELKADKE